MILRIVRGRVPAAGLETLADGFRSSYAPLARGRPGLVRFHAAVRETEDGYELVVVTFWSSIAAASDAYGGDLTTPITLDGLSSVATMSDVAYFEVDESQLRRSESPASLLRLTFGRVARGVDAEIQHELRGRLHELEPAMTEAYVGRRIVGTEVEVAFVSAWATDGTTRSMEEPFWPEISARYDSFEVRTYVPIVSGAEGT